MCRCGCDPPQIRRSDGWRFAEAALPAVINVERGELKVSVKPF